MKIRLIFLSALISVTLIDDAKAQVMEIGMKDVLSVQTQQLSLACQLVRYGYQTKSAMPLVLAVQMFRNQKAEVETIIATKVEVPSSQEGDGRKHKVVHLIRARLHILNTVDVLGGEAGDIASSYMFNARQSNNPFDNRLNEYSAAIGKMVTMANKDTAAKQDAEFDAALKSLRGTTSQSTSKETSSEDPQGLDCDWE